MALITPRQLLDHAAGNGYGVPICLHQDHGNNEATCQSETRDGFTSVMMDGSLIEDVKTPAFDDDNVAIATRVADAAHWVGASVEGDWGFCGLWRPARPGNRPARVSRASWTKAGC